MSWPTAKLSTVAPAVAFEGDLPDQEAYWLLNLDQVESHSGRVLTKVRVSKQGIGGSICAFGKEHVLYSKLRPNLSKVVIPDELGYCTSELVPLLPNSKKLDRKYLAYYLRSDDFVNWAVGKTAGAKMPRLNMKLFGHHEIPLPPLETQKHIARVLEQADQLRKQAQQMESELNQLAQSLFLEMFGDPVKSAKKWKTLPLKSVSKKFNDGPFGSNLKSEHYVGSGVRVIRLQNIAAGAFVDKDKAYISQRHAESLNKFWCTPGDIVIATLGDPNLRACIIPEEIPLAINKADCVHCIPDRNVVETEWLACYLNLPQTLSMIASDLHGQTRTRISSGQLAKLQVPIPPLKEQKLFAKRIDQIRHVQEACEQQKAKIEESFESLMQRAFKGELTAPGSKAA